MNSKIKLTDAQKLALRKIYRARHDDAGYLPGLQDDVRVSTAEALRKHGLVTSHSINKYRFVLTAAGEALADELYGGLWINDVFGEIAKMHTRRVWEQAKENQQAAIFAKYPFIPRDAAITLDSSGGLLEINLDTVSVVSAYNAGWRVMPHISYGIAAADAVVMAEQLLDAAAIAEQLNVALEGERLIKEGA